MRGDRQTDASTVTIAARGELAEPAARAELDRAASGRDSRHEHASSWGSSTSPPTPSATAAAILDRGCRDRARPAPARRGRRHARRRRRVHPARAPSASTRRSSRSACCRSCGRSPRPGAVGQHRHDERVDRGRRGGGRRADRQRRLGRPRRPRHARRRRRDRRRRRARPLARAVRRHVRAGASTTMSSREVLARARRAHRGRRGRRHPARPRHRRPRHRLRQEGRAELGGAARAAAPRRARPPRAGRHEPQAVPRRDAGARMPATPASTSRAAISRPPSRACSPRRRARGPCACTMSRRPATRCGVARELGGGGPMDFADEITLTGLRVFGRHGVYERRAARRPGLRRRRRRCTSTRAAAAASDDVADTVHYGEVAERVAAIVAGEPVDLLETLAARIADAAARLRRRSSGARVTVHKPHAPDRRCRSPTSRSRSTRGAGRRDEPPARAGLRPARHRRDRRRRRSTPSSRSAPTSATAPTTLARGDRRAAPPAARRRRPRVGAGRVGRGQAGRAGCLGPGLPQRRRARHHPPRPDGAAGVPARDRGAARPRARASAGATAPSTSTSSPTATCAATTPRCCCRIRAPPSATSCSAPWLSLDPDAELPGAGRVDALLERLRSERREAHRSRHPAHRRRASASRRASCSTRCSPRAGAPTFTPAITLPILLVLLGALVVALALPDPPRDARRRPRRAGQSVPRAAHRDAREGVEHRRRRRRRVRGRAGALPADPPRRPSLGSMGAIIATAVCGGAPGRRRARRRAPVHDPEG